MMSKKLTIPLIFPEDLMGAVRANKIIALAPYLIGEFDHKLKNIGVGESYAYDCGGKMRVHIACNHNH
jgi:hypothetical protein